MKKIIIFFVLSFFSLNSFAEKYKITYSDTLMYFGTKLYKSGDLISATAKLDSCIMLNPKNDECRFYRAKIAYDTKDFELGKLIFKSVLALQERDAVSWNMLGLCFQELKQYDSAEFCFKNAVGLNSKESRFFSNWGKNEYLRGNYQHAEQLFNTAILIDPSVSNHFEGRAEVLKKLGNKQAAIADYQQAKTLNPSNTRVIEKLSAMEEKNYNSYYLLAGLFIVFISVLLWWKNRKKTI